MDDDGSKLLELNLEPVGAANVDGPGYEDFDFDNDALVEEEEGPLTPTDKSVSLFIRIAYEVEAQCRGHIEAIRSKRLPEVAGLGDFEHKVTQFADYLAGLEGRDLSAQDMQEALDVNNAEIQLDSLIQTAAEIFEDYGLRVKAQTFMEWKSITVLEMELSKTASIRQRIALSAAAQLRENFPMFKVFAPALSGHLSATEELLDEFSDIERNLDVLTDAERDLSQRNIHRVYGVFINCLSSFFDNNEDEFSSAVFEPYMGREDYESARSAIENPWVCKEYPDFAKVTATLMKCLKELLNSQKEEILNRIVEEYEALAPQA